jgi:hypothetical protein
MIRVGFFFFFFSSRIYKFSLKCCSDSVNSYFPTVKPYVVTDMPFTLDNHINTMFVSPHEYGVWAATTRKKQLVVWDSTISGVRYFFFS